MNKQLLIETRLFTPSTPISLSEIVAQGRGGNLFVEGILATVEVKNGNGRYYSRQLWEREIDKFNKKISQRSTETCGELDHPESQIINMKNISHAIRKTRWEGDNIIGIIEVFSDQGELGTTSGRIMGALIKNGLNIGMSSRGMGSLQQVGEIMEVQDDFDLLTWDAVSNPSNPGSWFKQQSQLNEGKTIIDPYSKTNSIITDILCSHGSCPIF